MTSSKSLFAPRPARSFRRPGHPGSAIFPQQSAGPLSRREMLRNCAAGFGGLALAALLQEESVAERLEPKQPHFPPRAKRVIFLFMHGGPSQVDTFDYKPLLERDHGRPLPFAKPRVVSSATDNLLRSPCNFQHHPPNSPHLP